MTEFDFAALEAALTKKGRAVTRDLSLQTKSRQQLYDEAKRLASDYDDVYNRGLYTRHNGIPYWVIGGELRQDSRWEKGDIDKVPIEVFKKLVVNGRRILKDYYTMLNDVMMTNPEIALEANLNEKTGKEVLDFVYDKQVERIQNLLRRRVHSPVALSIDFSVTVELPVNGSFVVNIHWRSQYSGHLTIPNIEKHPRKKKDMLNLVNLLKCIDQVIDQINQQLDGIKIERG